MYSRSYPNKRNPVVAMIETVKSSALPRIPINRGWSTTAVGEWSAMLMRYADPSRADIQNVLQSFTGAFLALADVD
jgi:hypothetical protein